ncbi:MAG: hypothetical protein ACC682_01905 [Gemmatimonadota bacterium]
MQDRTRFLAVGALILALSAAGVRAQEVTPGVATMRYYQCGMADLADAVEILNGTWREVADELVSEGVLLGYGIMTHSWGDEWNLVDYFVAADTEAFHSAWTELLLRYQARDRDGSDIRKLGELCPVHKDNIYSVVPPR